MQVLSRRTFLGGFAAGALGTLLGAEPAEANPGSTISLLECHVAGTSYRPNGLEDVEPSLECGDVLSLEREPQNRFDTLAIAVYDRHGRHLGYVPRADNQVLARLMDAGYKLSARLDGKQWVGSWLRLDMAVRLNCR